MRITYTFIAFFITNFVFAQVNYTAKEIVPPYEGRAFFGTNMGYYNGWQDEQLADIAAGNTELDIQGIGAQALRPTLPENFLEQWGYNIRASTFDHYRKLGLNDNTCFVQSPTPAHRETEIYCGSEPSHLFANIYLDIWDNGENGTPVNDENYYALYLYRTVSMYKDHVKFWEIWNEPDFAFTSNSTEPIGSDGNWWENNPDPCEYKLRAPIQHYIRTLRISYEVIKSIDPTAFVAVGGLGYPSFLDAILRQTDNPVDGSKNAEYPHHGGAYFDVLSYHSYPHIDNSLREWSNMIQGFEYFRHSDRAVQGLVNLKKEFEEVLIKHNYDGTTYPEKHWIITETNIPRVKYGEFIGSDVAQRNYMIKSLVACLEEGITQYHVFNLAEANSLADENEFNFMGLYKPLSVVAPYEQKKTNGGIAYETTSRILQTLDYDAIQTTQLNPTPDVRATAFKHLDSTMHTYVLWAKTDTDESEEATASFSFPADWNVEFVEIKNWDYAKTGLTKVVSADNIALTGAPIFVTPVQQEEVFTAPNEFSITAFPNPFEDSLIVNYSLKKPTNVVIDMYDITGKLIRRIIENPLQAEGSYQVLLDVADLTPGVYLFQMTTVNDIISKKVLKR